MQIESIAAENFRLLVDKSKNKIMLDQDYTLIVGRNNSGKTSFIELVDKFTTNNSFYFADFSSGISDNSDLILFPTNFILEPIISNFPSKWR